MSKVCEWEAGAALKNQQVDHSVVNTVDSMPCDLRLVASTLTYCAGAWPDRFKCLVSHDGNLDESLAYFDTEELWFPERDHGGTPWTHPEAYRKHNPVDLVQNWKTPILVIHGGRDYRVVDTQGISTFTAAQRREIPSQLLYFPDENHWVLKPQNSILWHDTVLAWLDKWTR